MMTLNTCSLSTLHGHGSKVGSRWVLPSYSYFQSIGAPRSGALRSGAALRVAGARSERRSRLLPGALLGAALRKMAGALPGALRSDLRSGRLKNRQKIVGK